MVTPTHFLPKLNRNACALFDALMASTDVKFVTNNGPEYTEISAMARLIGNEDDLQEAMELLKSALVKIPLKENGHHNDPALSEGNVFPVKAGGINANIHLSLEGSPEDTLTHLKLYQEKIKASLVSAKSPKSSSPVDHTRNANALAIYEGFMSGAASDDGIQEIDAERHGVISATVKLRASRIVDINKAAAVLIDALEGAGMRDVAMSFGDEHCQRSKEGKRNMMTMPFYLLVKDTQPAAMRAEMKERDAIIRDTLTHSTALTKAIYRTMPDNRETPPNRR